MSVTNSDSDMYNDLIKHHAGQWVILKGDKVLSSYKNFSEAFIEYKKIRDDLNTQLIYVDSGEATFYAIKSESEGTKTRN